MFNVYQIGVREGLTENRSNDKGIKKRTGTSNSSYDIVNTLN